MSIEAFDGAVEQRKNEGLTLDNRLVAIEQAVISEATLERGVGDNHRSLRGGHRRRHPQCRRAGRRRFAQRCGADARPVDVPPRHRFARSQLAADRDRRGRVRLLAPGARARVPRSARRLRDQARHRRSAAPPAPVPRRHASSAARSRAGRSRPAAMPSRRASSSISPHVLRSRRSRPGACRLSRQLPRAERAQGHVGPDPGRRLAELLRAGGNARCRAMLRASSITISTG